MPLLCKGYFEDAARVFQRLVELGGAKNQRLGFMESIRRLRFAYNMMMAIECRRGDMPAALERMASWTVLVDKSGRGADEGGGLVSGHHHLSDPARGPRGTWAVKMPSLAP